MNAAPRIVISTEAEHLLGLGLYTGAEEEDTVGYQRADGTYSWVPADCCRTQPLGPGERWVPGAGLLYSAAWLGSSAEVEVYRRRPRTPDAEQASPFFDEVPEGIRRVVAYFTCGGTAVVCAECADGVVAALGPASLEAHYYTARPLMCGHCGAYIGPLTVEEAHAR